jgi:hypothetical protein
LIHETLPYPGAFLSDDQVATRLGVTPNALNALIRDLATDWSRALSEAVYRGPAASLFPRRWWAAGVADASLTVAIAVREGQDKKQVLQALSGSDDVALLRERDPVAIVNGDMIDAGIAPASKCVQLRPRGWPPQCEEPWMRITEAASAPWFRHMIDPSDQPLLDAPADE